MLAAFVALTVCAQSALQDARDELRTSGGISVIGALLDISSEMELSGSILRIDDSIGTRISTRVLPFRSRVGTADDYGFTPVVEGGAAYSKAHGRTDDLLQGNFPGQELGISTTWRSYGGQVGGGMDFDAGSGIHFSAVGIVGLYHVDNRTFYSGPGTPLLQPLLDDILFNWQATLFAYGGALRAEGHWDLSQSLHLDSSVRYDGRAYETLRSTDAAQEDNDPTHMLTLRVEPAGPLGIDLAGRPLGWKGLVAFRRYFGAAADQLDFRGYIEIGGELQIGLPGELPFLAGLRLGGAWIWGPDVKGWTAGVSASF